MATAADVRAHAAELPEGDVIRILLEQHARIRDLFSELVEVRGERRQQVFGELRALLAVHETAEEMVLRPMTELAVGSEVGEARNQEESDANEALAELERLEPDSREFQEQLATFRADVEAHAEAEENDEFPRVLAGCSLEERIRMGTTLRSVEKVAPTHPHPSTAGKPVAQWAVGPFAAMVDRARDAVKSATK